ncbi:MAG TPA: carotenoid biosynthesis protein [Bacteroidetes bacterium]|nr:carotenoid biosynthesis protein [Bacteroidota bacterium]|tara:strand:+ start:2898 stop:3626 length:729 start_codon:yes stop_codon:yes gene_type:complete
MPQISGFLASWRGWAIIIVIVLHTVGGICMALGDPIGLVLLTPAHLSIVTFMLFSVHPPLNREFYKAAFLTFMFGMFIEIIGVKTGNIFGEYHYTSLLGPRVLGVPIVIGTNWLLLSYCFSTLVLWWQPSLRLVYQVVIGALLMVLLDVIIEPFAVHYGLWVWKGRILPSIANYIAWFFGGCIVTLIWLGFWRKPANQQKLTSKSAINEGNVVLTKNNDILLVTILSLVVFFLLSWVGIMLG